MDGGGAVEWRGWQEKKKTKTNVMTVVKTKSEGWTDR